MIVASFARQMPHLQRVSVPDIHNGDVIAYFDPRALSLATYFDLKEALEALLGRCRIYVRSSTAATLRF